MLFGIINKNDCTLSFNGLIFINDDQWTIVTTIGTGKGMEKYKKKPVTSSDQ